MQGGGVSSIRGSRIIRGPKKTASKDQEASLSAGKYQPARLSVANGRKHNNEEAWHWSRVLVAARDAGMFCFDCVTSPWFFSGLFAWRFRSASSFFFLILQLSFAYVPRLGSFWGVFFSSPLPPSLFSSLPYVTLQHSQLMFQMLLAVTLWPVSALATFPRQRRQSFFWFLLLLFLTFLIYFFFQSDRVTGSQLAGQLWEWRDTFFSCHYWAAVSSPLWSSDCA